MLVRCIQMLVAIRIALRFVHLDVVQQNQPYHLHRGLPVFFFVWVEQVKIGFEMKLDFVVKINVYLPEN